MSAPLHSTEEAIDYLTRTVGIYPHFDIDQFEHGWLVVPCPSPEEEAAGVWMLGYTQRIVDARTGVITEFGSSASPTEAIRQYSAFVEDGTPMSGIQIYPHRTEIHVHRIEETPTVIEYFTQVRDIGSGETQPAFILTINKQTRHFEPTDAASRTIFDWATMSFETDRVWPTSGTVLGPLGA
ncbi:hypothetical protein ACFWPX_22855 [Nocardia sp. NPDC058518]|uniref:hypothetical protein n=1 Tax=Nocardia sp. NPDC058518 TaxID=3346534 RepID=UPI003652A967